MQNTHQQKHATGSTSDANDSRFFKVVHDVTIEKQMLRFPPKFLRKYGNSLQKKNIVLKVPNGKEWRMALKKCGNEVWLDIEWKEFADYYSIRFGHFLVFAYNGNSCFDVTIFGKSGSEIQCPITYNPGNEIKIEESYDDISLEIMGDCSYLRAKVERKEFDGAEVLKKKKATALATDKIRAIEKANAYKTENPHFVVTMRPSYVSSYFKVNIPLVFVRKYFNKKHQNARLQADEKTWSMRYYIKQGRSTFARGWSDFARDNELKVDDVCVFELIGNVENSMQVVIFRDSEGTA